MILILGGKKILIFDVSGKNLYISGIGYLILVTKIRNEGMISDILTNFIPNTSALNT